MKVIVVGGGTGGHIYPAIAIADKIVEREPNSEILFIGTKNGLEKSLVPAAGYKIKFIDIVGLQRKRLLKNVTVVQKYIRAQKAVKSIINEFKPDAIIGTGGYVSAPVVSAGAKMGVKTFIQEQNAYPGISNKMLEKFVSTLFLGFAESGDKFKLPEKHIVSGNPVRDSFFKAEKCASRDKLKIKEKFVILSFGGSQGSAIINESMFDVVDKYNGNYDVRIIFVTGKRYYSHVLEEFHSREIILKDNVEIKEYIVDMEDYLSAADLVVSRSGALAVSEIAVCRTPSILIPLAIATGDHQTFNAKVLSDKGAAILIPEPELNGKRLVDEIQRLVLDNVTLKKMSDAAWSVAPVDATEIIYSHIKNELEDKS
ncbi:MAG: undecaprenyldiphospho-muramoylpentapeptide beta-N-acetylglucosaminyltransferase [Eubacteriales bacterium]|nr:undecaprenyldiphospho-muramoylpentapeptide beta-N-acetylglucosaminyltransferase [Eubacteriales bacterium]MDY3332150.1 undecaprenyldiphospho-muramoylpentapeptide beta-N-acetylglucosaminyltransferase [Gallibacter sp.]